MTNQPGLIADSLIEFGQGGDYHTHSMTEAKERAGFAPLETLPAEWYNNYLYKLDAHINQLQTIARQMQTELSNVITFDSCVTPSATCLTQVSNAIGRMISGMLPSTATGSVPGTVVSSSGLTSVSVDSSGVMTVNGLADWTGTQTVKEYIDCQIADGTVNNAICFNGCTYAQMLEDVTSQMPDGDTALCTCWPTWSCTYANSTITPIGIYSGDTGWSRMRPLEGIEWTSASSTLAVPNLVLKCANLSANCNGTQICEGRLLVANTLGQCPVSCVYGTPICFGYMNQGCLVSTTRYTCYYWNSWNRCCREYVCGTHTNVSQGLTTERELVLNLTPHLTASGFICQHERLESRLYSSSYVESDGRAGSINYQRSLKIYQQFSIDESCITCADIFQHITYAQVPAVDEYGIQVRGRTCICACCLAECKWYSDGVYSVCPGLLQCCTSRSPALFISTALAELRSGGVGSVFGYALPAYFRYSAGRGYMEVHGMDVIRAVESICQAIIAYSCPTIYFLMRIICTGTGGLCYLCASYATMSVYLVYMSLLISQIAHRGCAIGYPLRMTFDLFSDYPYGNTSSTHYAVTTCVNLQAECTPLDMALFYCRLFQEPGAQAAWYGAYGGTSSIIVCTCNANTSTVCACFRNMRIYFAPDMLS